MLIPIIWTAIVSLFSGVAVYCNCLDSNEHEAGLFICILAIAFSFAALMLCLAAGM